MVEESLARKTILNSIQKALGSRVAGSEAEYATVPRHYQTRGGLPAEERLELLADRLRDYDAVVYNCEESSLPGTIRTALGVRSIFKILSGQSFPAAWLPPDLDFSRDAAFDYDQINRYEGVVTACALAIAETGTIILRHADGEPRRAVSLIPDYHLCIVFASQVVETVPEGIRAMANMGAAPLTTISGPSATADIEMTRVKGVHGPRTLDVILVLD
jgi:L-lactate dehydrogenase complex protein LldG